jgi:hypothetical protein
MSEGAPAAKRFKTDGGSEMPPSIVADISLAAEGEQLIELAESNMWVKCLHSLVPESPPMPFDHWVVCGMCKTE